MIVLGLTASALVIDASVNTQPAAADTKCEYRYVKGVTGYHGPGQPIYGPVWKNVCGLSHSHWYYVSTCVAYGTVLASVGTIPGIIIGAVVATICVEWVQEKHTYWHS
jgi:hypothetical protein